jgi:hypothetical protein
VSDFESRSVVEMTTEAVIIRCRCGDPASHQGEICPKGQTVDLGVISYWHRNPLKRLAHAVSNFAKSHDFPHVRVKKQKEK